VAFFFDWSQMSDQDHDARKSFYAILLAFLDRDQERLDLAIETANAAGIEPGAVLEVSLAFVEYLLGEATDYDRAEMRAWVQAGAYKAASQ
jgi:hypothetical protein